MGVSGTDGKKLGSVSEEVVTTSPLTTVLIKDLYAAVNAFVFT